jgi:DNA-binding Xre family transcriptional regulator
MVLGKNIRKLLIDRGENQVWLAITANITESTLSNLIKGAEPRAGTLIKLRKALDCTWPELMDGVEYADRSNKG